MESLELTGTRPPSVTGHRPSSRNSNRPGSGYHRLADRSSVDELLFTSHHPRHEDVVNFKPPWTETPRNKKSEKDKQPKLKPLLWAPSDNRTSITSQSDRGGGLRMSNKGFHVDADRLNKYRPKKHTASFCDETLFGPRLEEPSFEAPWAEKVKKGKPLIFSPVDYAKLTREQSACSARYSSAGTMDGRPPSRQGRRPRTATTRPVTVEVSNDVEKPVWVP